MGATELVPDTLSAAGGGPETQGMVTVARSRVWPMWLRDVANDRVSRTGLDIGIGAENLGMAPVFSGGCAWVYPVWSLVDADVRVTVSDLYKVDTVGGAGNLGNPAPVSTTRVSSGGCARVCPAWSRSADDAKVCDLDKLDTVRGAGNMGMDPAAWSREPTLSMMGLGRRREPETVATVVSDPGAGEE